MPAAEGAAALRVARDRFQRKVKSNDIELAAGRLACAEIAPNELERRGAP